MRVVRSAAAQVIENVGKYLDVHRDFVDELYSVANVLLDTAHSVLVN